MIRRLAALLISGLALLLLAPTQVHSAPPAPPSAPVVLAGQTTVLADHSASILVEVPSLATYATDTYGNPDLAVSGRGRVVALTLQPVASRDPYEALRVARFNGCDSLGCEPDRPDGYVQVPSGARRVNGHPPRALLEPGTYRLTVLTDGGRVSASLRLGGLSGSTLITPTAAGDSRILPAAETLSAPAAGAPAVWSGGAELNLASTNTLVFGFYQQETPGGSAFSTQGACHFSAGTRPLGGHFLPGCPGELGSAGTISVGSVTVTGVHLGSDQTHRFITQLRPTARGSQHAGIYSEQAGVPDPPFAYFAVLGLDA